MSQQKDTGETEVSAGGANPMAMGMEMARKMMGKMGKEGPGPMAMMQEMMAKMGHGAEGGPQMPPMMQMCMGMCAEILSAIREINALAVFPAPELQHAFADWIRELEGQAATVLGDGEKDAAALAAALGVSEESARYLLARLAESGKAALVGRLRS